MTGVERRPPRERPVPKWSCHWHRWWRAALLSAAPLVGLSGCGGSERTAPVVVPRLTPQESMLQVSAKWTTVDDEQRLLNPPSRTAIHRRRVESRIELSNPSPRERLTITEQFELRDGQAIACKAEATVSLGARYRWRNGEAAVGLERPVTQLDFHCAPFVPPDLRSTLPASSIELVLRDESLIVVQPATDRRKLHPED